MSIIVAATAIVDRISGNEIRQKTCHSLAPSSRADSSSDFGIPLYVAERTTMQKPVQIHTPTKISAKLLTHGRSISHPMGCPPNATTIPLSSPVCATVAGRKE